MTAPNPDTQHFTIDDANRMLPLVRAIVTDIVALAEDLDGRQQRLGSLITNETEKHDPDSVEVRLMQVEVEADEVRLGGYIAELVDLGVELQDALHGEVDFRTQDFRTQIGGREAFLCWKLGEPEVGHWHTEADGFAGRQSLLQGASAADSFSSPEATES